MIPSTLEPSRLHSQRTFANAPAHTIGALVLALLLVLGTVAGLKLERAAAQSWFMVIDRAAVLDERQERSAINDAWRLNQIGIPTQVVIEPLALDQDRADSRAGELRIAHGVESSPGADDGLLVYLSTDPTGTMPSVVAFAVGSRTMPTGGLTRGDLETIRETTAIPQLEAGHPARAIVYSMREVIYQHVFTPPPGEIATERSDQVQSVLLLVGPVLALAIAIWIHRSRRGWSPIAMAGFAGVLVFALAVYGRSEVGIASAIAILLAVGWSAVTLDNHARRTPQRHLRATPRPPGTRVAMRRVFRTDP